MSSTAQALPPPAPGPGNPLRNLVALVGRILLVLIFVRAGINKIGTPGPTIDNMTNHGFPMPDVLVWGAIVMELGGGLLVVAGLFARCAALALAIYTAVLACIFHAYWAAPAAGAQLQAAFFFGHLSMIGGLLCVVAFGAGAWSLDALWRGRA